MKSKVDRPKVIKKVLITNPFSQDFYKNVGIDPIVSRHAGQEIKTGLTFPLGLAYIASTLEKRGIDVVLIDPLVTKYSNAKMHELASRVDMIITPLSYEHRLEQISFFKTYSNKWRVFVGEHARAFSDDYLQTQDVDFVITGEAELSIENFLRHQGNLSEVKGIRYYHQGEFKENAKEFIDDLDNIPFPKRDFENQKKYWDLSFWGRPTAYILCSRGCPFDCKFCAKHSLYGKKVRFRTAKNIVDEIESVVKDHKIKCFQFFDDTFTLKDEWVRQVAEEIIDRDLKIEWIAAARVEQLNEQTLLLMKKAGCIEVQLGVESFNDELLQNIEKGHTVKDIEKGLTLLNRLSFTFSLHLIIGIPGETDETVERTMKMLKRFKPLFVSFNILTPLPGSKLFLSKKEESYQGFDILHSSVSYCQFSARKLQQIVRSCYLRYYLSLSFVYKLLKEFLKRPRLVFHFLKTVVKQGIYFFRSIVLGL